MYSFSVNNFMAVVNDDYSHYTHVFVKLAGFRLCVEPTNMLDLKAVLWLEKYLVVSGKK